MTRDCFNPNHNIIRWASLILSVIFLFNFTTGFAQVQPDDPKAIAQWTFMVYMDGDNDLEENGIDNFLWMSEVGSTDNVNILVQFDRIPLFDSRYDNWTGAKRYWVTKDMTPNNANATQNLGEVNMGNPQTLIDFVQWGIAAYPAEHYAIVLWDHGSGWKPNTIQLATDFTNGIDGLEMPELRNAFDTLTFGGTQPIDLIGFDACLMAMIEVDNQILPYGLVRVGSEEIVPREALPYNKILADLVATPSMSATDLGQEIVLEYYDYYDSYTLSALYLGNPYLGLNTAVDNFAQVLIDGVSPFHAQIQNARSDTQFFILDNTYLDLYDFAYQINQHIVDATINSAANAVMDAINTVIISERHGSLWSGAHGISIYFPGSADDYDTRYDGINNWLVFTSNNHWDEWLRAFFYLPEWTATMFMPIIANR